MSRLRFLSLLLATALLAGCGSSIKLDDVPVEDRTASAVPPQGGAGSGSSAGTGATGQSAVAPVTVAPAAQDPAPPAGLERVIYFDFDSHAIRPEFQTIIEGHARHLRASGARKVVIEGHTDERGGREYNLALGQRRAEAVRRALGLLGVPDAQVEAVSFGKEKPAVPGSDEAAWARNRRAEIVYR